MNVVDIPQPCTRELYEEAISRYASMVRNRAISLYQVGNVTYPGLSDIDLMVVTDHAALDNRFFFSALHRLPERYHRLFLHEPFVLPAWSLRVLCHTTHYGPKFIAGRDVLQPFLPCDDPDERWCRMLESYCSYLTYVEKIRRLRQLKGRETIAVANALRYLLADASCVIPEAANQTYGTEIEDVRRTFFEDGADPVERIRSAWELLASAFGRFDGLLREFLKANTAEQALETARALLHGEQACPYFDRDYAFVRSRDIEGYQHELASLGFPFGHLFFVAAHPGYRRMSTATPVLEALIRNVYRVRRRLTEYARA